MWMPWHPHPLLEGRWLEAQACRFADAKHEVHVLHGLSYGTFEQVVDTRRDEQLAVDDVAMDQRLVGVDHLLHVERLVDVMGGRPCTR